jgi:SAM-dependent methyltransferase
VGRAEEIPYPNGTFDLVFSNNVPEHLPDPVQAFCEVARVLKPGGPLSFQDTNRFHYVAVIARSTPHWFSSAGKVMTGSWEQTPKRKAHVVKQVLAANVNNGKLKRDPDTKRYGFPDWSQEMFR